MKKWLMPALLSSLALYSCTNVTERNNATRENKAATIEVITNSKAEILNNIIVQESGGLHISHAYLAFENGRLLPKTNTVLLGEKVYLNLVVDKISWANKRKVYISASQNIVTNKGQLVLKSPNLFENLTFSDTGKPDHIYLQATIIKTRPDIDYFIVDYRVWDKDGDGEVKGSYKLYLETESARNR